MLCCLAVQLQEFAIGVTTRDPDRGPVPRGWNDINNDQYWYVSITFDICSAWHNDEWRELEPTELQWVLEDPAGNTVGCQLSGTGELHPYYNGRDLGVAWEGLPTDQPLWGFVFIPDWTLEANYVIPKGEAVWCDVCVM